MRSERADLNWEVVAQCFDEALSRSGRDRASLLEELDAREPLLAREVRSLLESMNASDGFLEPIGEGGLAEVLEDRVPLPPCGSRLGAFLLERVIASGGMGPYTRRSRSGHGERLP